MTVRGGATMSWWWLACLLAGCVQPRDQQPGGTFGHSRSDLFTDPVAADPVAADPAAGNTAAAATDAVGGGASPFGAASNSSPAAGNELPEATLTPKTSSRQTPHPEADAESLKSHANRNNSLVSAKAIPPSTTIAAPKTVGANVTTRGRTERQLRNAFANANKEEITQAALDLAGYLVQQERYFDALFVIDSGLKRQHTVPLRLARAGLLRDVARCDLAAIELQGVVRQLGAKNVSPATLFDLVQAEWVAGQGDAAAATLRSIQHAHAGDAWLRDHATDMAHWDRRIREVAPGRDPLANGELRDLFALLRAAPEAAGRLKMLDTLAAPPKTQTDQNRDPQHRGPADLAAQHRDERRPIRIRAIATACADESTAVRARAVYLAAANGLIDVKFWQVALTDTAPLVRRFAAKGACQQHGHAAAPLLFEAICREHDEPTFEALHATLATALATTAPPCTANTAAGRKLAIAHWRSQCEQ